MIIDGTALTLGSDHQMGEVWVESAATFDITGRRMGLSGAGLFPALTIGGTLVTAGSTIIYNGVETQTLAYSKVHYHHLIISNTVAVEAEYGYPTIGGHLINQGNFVPGFDSAGSVT